MQNETHIFVKNIVKVYPNRIRVVEYEKGFYKKLDNINPADEWLDRDQYHQHLIQKAFSLQEPEQKPNVVQIPMPHARGFKYFQQQQSNKLIEHPSVAILARMHSLNVSMRRTKLNIVDIIACNDFDMFVTFSFGKDHYDIEKCKQKMSKWLNNQQQKHKKTGEPFGYLIVPEFHKDKKAIHFHALLNKYRGRIVKSKHPKTGRQIVQKGKAIFNLAEYNYGFTNMSFIVNKEATARYVTKYVTKDIIDLKGQRRYWFSRGLKKPEKLYNEDLGDIELETVYEGEGFTISRSDVKLNR